MPVTWNPADKVNVTLSNGNLTAVATTSFSAGVRATVSQTTGKFYFEVTIAGSLYASGIAIGKATSGLTFALTSTQVAMVRADTGGVFIDGSGQLSNIGGFVAGNVACVAVDLTNQKIWFRKNGGNWNNSGTDNPATNAGGHSISALLAGAAAFPMVAFDADIPTFTANFGAGTFSYTVPSGFASGWEAIAPSASGLVGSGAMGAFWAQDTDDRGYEASRKRRRKFLEDRVRRVREL